MAESSARRTASHVEIRDDRSPGPSATVNAGRVVETSHNTSEENRCSTLSRLEERSGPSDPLGAWPASADSRLLMELHDSKKAYPATPRAQGRGMNPVLTSFFLSKGLMKFTLQRGAPMPHHLSNGQLGSLDSGAPQQRPTRRTRASGSPSHRVCILP